MSWNGLCHRVRRAHLGLCLLAGLAACAQGEPQEGGIAARLRVASAAEASGQPEVALSILRTLAATAPENVDVQARYAKALVLAGNLGEAETVTTQALRRHPGNQALLRELGDIKVLTGKPSEALDAFQAVLRVSPNEVSALTGRGVALDLLDRNEQAQASYRAALAIDPQNLPALNNLALSLILAARPQEALALLEPLAGRGDAPDRVRNNLAVARAASSGGTPEAVANAPLAQAVSGNPEVQADSSGPAAPTAARVRPVRAPARRTTAAVAAGSPPAEAADGTARDAMPPAADTSPPPPAVGSRRQVSQPAVFQGQEPHRQKDGSARSPARVTEPDDPAATPDGDSARQIQSRRQTT